MFFYNASKLLSKPAICQEIDRLCDSDDTNYPRLDKTARVNQALEEVVGKIISADGVWEWDDTNQSDLPVGTGNLIEGQESYSFAADYLKVKRLKVKNANGSWQLLEQIDQQDLDGSKITIESYFGLDVSGNPNKGPVQYYDILGDSIRLYPSPTSTSTILTGGLKIDFVRTAVLFTPVSTTADDTTEPGLPASYHILLAYKAALPYCMAYKPGRVNFLLATITRLESDMIKHFSRRNPDRKSIMKTRIVPFR